MTGHQAVAEVIKATGFTAMAQQYLDEPSKREAIRVAMTKIIAKEHGKAKAARFSILAASTRGL